MNAFVLRLLLVCLCGMFWAGRAPAQAQAKASAGPQDTLAQRLVACTHCHGVDGRAGPDGYYPRLAGKPEAYLYNQLLNFRDGRRHYGAMVSLVDHLSDDYLREMARYFAQQNVPYPAPQRSPQSAATLARGQQLVTLGDPARKIPACVQCHGSTLTGVLPAIPGLLGLPRDYLASQLGAWISGQRKAQSPDCMADIARRLTPDDVSAITAWVSSQPWPAGGKPAATLGHALSQPCGSGLTDPGLSKAPQVAQATTVATSLIERGAYLAKAGNCLSCHTTRGGAPFAGGRALSTPFGAVYSSNLTPDATTGLGRWTADDFWQAMHHGQARDGRSLYPVFPYPNYTQVTRADSDALFAYLRSLPPVRQARPEHDLSWPFNTQWALGIWRALFFRPGTFQAESTQSAEWNRGAYLVNGLGHCGACHTPRNALGAEQGSKAFLSGAVIDGWEAPALTALSRAPVPWSEQELYRYLRKGHTEQHGVASGPMAPVVKQLTALPDADIRAMATYLASFNPPITEAASQQQAKQVVLAAQQSATQLNLQGPGQRLFNGACASCHHDGNGPTLLGINTPLALNSNLHSDKPDNLIRVILGGIREPANADIGFMPAFRHSLDDSQITALASYMRSRYAPSQTPWRDLPGSVKRLRSAPDTH